MRAGAALCMALALTLGPTAAVAGAWTLEADQAVAIVGGLASQGNQVFDGGGRLRSAPRYSKQELQTLIEYGASDRVTVIVGPSLQGVQLRGTLDSERSGLGYTDVGARVRLGASDDWVLSGQTIFRIPGTLDKTNPAAIGYTDPEIDMRGLLGVGFKIAGWPAFVDIELAQRFRPGGPPDEFRADLSLGIRPFDRWLFLAQSFNVISEGAGTWGYASYAYYKAQLSVVYAVNRALSLQFGGFTTYAGRNALQENGLVMAAWYRF